MIRHSIYAGIALLATAASAVSAATYDPLIGLKTADGRLAEKLIHIWFVEAKPAEVFDKYVSKTGYLDHYGDHTTDWAQTRADEIKGTPPGGFFFQIKQVVSQGGLVFTNLRAKRSAADKGYGDDMIIIFRFKDGKLVESWNIHSPLEQDPALYFGERRPVQTGYSCADETCSTTRPPPAAAGSGEAGAGGPGPNAPAAGSALPRQ